MAIKTVTAQTLAGMVPQPEPAPVPEPTGEEPAVIVGMGEEKTADAPPDPGNQERGKSQQNGFQKRIDELTRERKEAEELAEDEYGMRLRAERRIAELEAEVQKFQKPEEKPKEQVEPKPEEFENAVDYARALAKYETQKALDERDRQQREAEQRAQMERQNELMRERVTLARKDLPDFDEVIEAASSAEFVVPVHVQAAIIDSEFGPYLAYHLAKSPEEQARIFKMTPAKALLELGKIEAKLAKADTKAEGTATKPPVETTRAPAPVGGIKADSGIVRADYSKPMGFKEYKAARLQEKRSRR